MENYDFSGWATRNDVRCTDGRTIRRDAFKHNDGQKVPLVWNHRHDTPDNVLGHAMLKNHEEGVYAYCKFNDTKNGQLVKTLVMHGDLTALSIYANQLQQKGGDVLHGEIREVSVVHAGANPRAYIDSVLKHSADGDVVESEDEADICMGEPIVLFHADAQKDANTKEEKTDVADETKKPEGEKTVEEVWDGITKKLDETELGVVYAMVGAAAEGDTDDSDDSEENETVKHSEGGNETMKNNVFDQNDVQTGGVLTHSDQENIIKMAKASNVGSLQNAIGMYVEQNDALKHGFDQDTLDQLFPDYKDVKSGAPELIERDQTWVGHVMSSTHKSPISRIRTRQMDARGDDLRAKGYKKGTEKTVSGNPKLMSRTTDPQTVYRKDALHRDDIIDITDFDVVEYQYGIMKRNLYEDLALATMVGDLRDDGDPDKISEEHIRPIWKDDELYTIHYTVDLAKARAELQGSDTSKHFGENYIYSEAFVTASLFAREQYKGSGSMAFYCTPRLVNTMLLARDLNGRRIYDSKSELAKALDVSSIHTAEQWEGLVRTTADGKKKKLLGIMVNLKDYQHGSTKGGEITRFEQFDIDFNQEKYLIETRLSGALIRIKSAIVFEEDVTENA